MRQRSTVLVFLIVTCGSLCVGLAAGDGSSRQEPGPSASPAAVEAELTRLIGAKKTTVVVEGKDAVLWAFFADGIKSSTGSEVTLKKNAPFASSKGEAPVGGVAAALGMTKDASGAGEKRTATKQDIAEALVGQLRNYGNRYVPFGGYWFTAPGPGQPGAPVAGVAGLLRKEQAIDVAAVIKTVESKLEGR